MVQSVVASSVATLAGMGFVFGTVLAVASRIFAVHRDPRVEQLIDTLPGVNCGACGFPGCHGYAEAAVSAGVVPLACPPGGPEVSRKIAEILGVDAGEHVPMVAVVHCAGGKSVTTQRLAYDGVMDCRAAMLVSGSPKACIFGCLGYGTCKEVCPFDAVTVHDGIVHIDPQTCTGCGKCVGACPVGIIELASRDMKVHIRCSSHDKGAAAKKICQVACIACQLCAKSCPVEAIEMKDNLAVIDYAKCTNCGVCASKCPTKAILDAVPVRPKALIGMKCTGTGKCVDVCPTGAIEGEPGTQHEVVREKCIGCGLCLDACPTRAISMVGALGHRKGAT